MKSQTVLIVLLTSTLRFGNAEFINDKSNLLAAIEKLQVNNDLCYSQFNTMVEANAEGGDLHAMKWFDSWGVFPNGLFSGNYESVGHFTQCIELRNDPSRDINGQHCMVYYTPMQIDPLNVNTSGRLIVSDDDIIRQ